MAMPSVSQFCFQQNSIFASAC
uniref:Uncharacterized protein n=1 Tax=Rhizophora mucronata TaxID=61149 RepID=A0A2P2P4R1_RHIMU